MTLSWKTWSAPFVALLLLVACGDSQPVSESPGPADSQESTSPSAQTPSPSAPEPAETPALIAFGSEAVWDPLESEDRLLQVQDCSFPGRTECAVATMHALGAPPEAIKFFGLTGWFLSDFQDMGRVDLGSLLDPWRANSNGDFALLNGTPTVVLVEEEGSRIGSAIQRDPAFDVLLGSFPELILWPTDNVFEALESSGDGGQRFIFQFYLTDGCHACITGYMARVALDFASDGTYLGPGALSLCRADWANAASVAESVAACPPIAETAPTEAIPDLSPR